MNRLDPLQCHQALAARDARFDGLFFVGVTTTAVYCRPVCPARTPLAANCAFFPTAAAAEKAGFRPCLRCRPELAPGLAPMDALSRLARAAVARIEAGALADSRNVDDLADELGVGPRQLRRAVQAACGVSPVQLAQTHRLLLAKKLLAETRMPLIDVAFASGFGSVRRFNHLFRSRYGLAPSKLRRAATPDGVLRLRLTYRPPLAWDDLLAFFGSHATAGVERVTGSTYSRSVFVGGVAGWVTVAPLVGKSALVATMPLSLAPVLPAVLARLRAMFDLDARPDAIAARLSEDALLAPLVAARPGLRLPGCFDGFEMLVRTILGQQVSVASATTLAGRLATAFGAPVQTPVEGVERAFPTPVRLAAATEDEMGELGIIATRSAAIRAVATEVRDGRLRLGPTPDPEEAIRRLCEMRGIGEWTAHSVAMRAMGWPDAFPHGDLAIRRLLGGGPPRTVLARAEAWRPWRAYATMHLWRSLSDPVLSPPPLPESVEGA